MDYRALCKKYEDYMLSLYKEFHIYPELSFEEKRTSSRVKEELDKMGIPYEEIPPNYGVVATISGETDGKVLAIRADMDALPVQEETELEYKSQVDGVMHACGHDAHIAMLLGTAAVLNEVRNYFKGNIKLCFQSAEEHGGGADEIIQYLELNGGVDQIIGLHVWATLETGFVHLSAGPCMAGSAGFEINIVGEGGHGSRPDLVRDPIKPACDLVLKITSIPGNFYDVHDSTAINVGQITAGTMYNIFPNEATIKGGYRYFKIGGDNLIYNRIKEMAEGVGKSYNVSAKVKYLGGEPPVVNHKEPVDMGRSTVQKIEDLDVVEDGQRFMESENFSYFLVKYPGFFAMLGAKNKDNELNYPHHHPKFNIDEGVLFKGCIFLTHYAVDFLI